MKAEIIVHSLPVCPNCERLKTFLKDNGLEYTERSLEDPEVVVDILYESGIHAQEAPVLCIDNNYYTSSRIFQAGVVDLSLFTGMI